MTTGIRRFILRVIVGLVTFLIGVAVAMAFTGFSPFESVQSERQQNYRHYRYKKSCNSKFRSLNMPPPAPVVPHGEFHTGTVHLKGPDGITVTVDR